MLPVSMPFACRHFQPRLHSTPTHLRRRGGLSFIPDGPDHTPSHASAKPPDADRNTLWCRSRAKRRSSAHRNVTELPE